MKPSGLDWAEHVPADWDVAALSSRFDIKLGKMLSPEAAAGPHQRPYLGNQHVQWDRVVTDDLPTMSVAPHEFERYRVRRGDLLVCEGGEVGRTAVWRGELDECCYQKAIHRVRPRGEDAHPRFAYYLLSAAAARGLFDAEGNRSTIVHLTGEQLRRHRFPFPSGREQRGIASFLDRRTECIDAVIAKKEQLLERLTEKRQTLISHTVTQGLDRGVATIDSGVPWVGRVPAHWTVRRLKHLGQIRSGIAKGRDAGDKPTQARPYLRVANVQNGWLDLADVDTIDVTHDEARRYALRPGDVLMNEGGDFDKLGRGYVWEGQIAGCIHQNHVFAMRPNAGVNPYWINLATQAAYLRHFFVLRSKQSTNLASISATNLGEAPIVMPPEPECEQLLLRVRAMLASFDRAARVGEDQLARLREYRQALITAAVTGKIDVTTQAEDKPRRGKRTGEQQMELQLA